MIFKNIVEILLSYSHGDIEKLKLKSLSDQEKKTFHTHTKSRQIIDRKRYKTSYAVLNLCYVFAHQ